MPVSDYCFVFDQIKCTELIVTRIDMKLDQEVKVFQPPNSPDGRAITKHHIPGFITAGTKVGFFDHLRLSCNVASILYPSIPLHEH